MGQRVSTYESRSSLLSSVIDQLRSFTQKTRSGSLAVTFASKRFFVAMNGYTHTDTG
jgi:hypothetical protein